jgi:hypothetical protein
MAQNSKDAQQEAERNKRKAELSTSGLDGNSGMDQHSGKNVQYNAASAGAAGKTDPGKKERDEELDAQRRQTEGGYANENRNANIPNSRLNEDQGDLSS